MSGGSSFVRATGGAAALLAGAALLGLGLQSAGATTRTVQIVTGNAYSPDVVYILRGDSVTWEYADTAGNSHTVTSRSTEDPFESNPRCNALLQTNCMDSPGQSYTHKFDKIGSFPYWCRVHQAAMTGTINVRERPSSPTPTPTKTKTAKPSVSGSASPSPSPSASGSLSPSPGASGVAGGPGGSGENSSGGKVAIAAILVAALAGAGAWVWRRFISLR